MAAFTALIVVIPSGGGAGRSKRVGPNKFMMSANGGAGTAAAGAAGEGGDARSRQAAAVSERPC